MIKTYLYAIIGAFVIASCSDAVHDAKVVAEQPHIYPDYIGVTIPADIAPMDFEPLCSLDTLSDEKWDCVDVVVKGSKGGEIHSNGDIVDFDVDEWHALTEQNKGGTLTFTVCVEKGGAWTQYKEFPMYVSKYALDEWGLTYRRVAPGYEVFAHMGLYQRDLSTFDEYEIIDNDRTPNNCVNCHTSNRTNPKEFLFHVRGTHGATAVSKNGKVDMLNTKTDQTLGLCVYPYWHPDGKYVVFSTNTTRQEFHVWNKDRIEVFDMESDLQVYDTEKHELLIAPQITSPDLNETFPAFSADGKTIYFTGAAKRSFPLESWINFYNLYSISFDPATGTFGDSVKTVIDVASDSLSIAIPKPSYDGKYLMYTQCNYGTFPIWHKEADLWLLNLQTGERRPLNEVNSDNTESYHNWSANSHWFVFSSRRGDGLYTRLYIASIDENGKATKPFLMPQKNPRHYYERLLYSYNVPDFTKAKVEMDQRSVANTIISDERIDLTVSQK